MLAKVMSAAVLGLDAYTVDVEVDISPGLPGFTIVGLPDTAVQESRERVRAAIRNCGATFPNRKITTNLAPAHLRKEGPAYDMPIAIGVLAAAGQVQFDTENFLFIGELALDGSLRPTAGVLPMVALAREKGVRQAIVPAGNAREAALVPGVEVIPANSLREVIDHLSGVEPIQPLAAGNLDELSANDGPLADFAEVKGQEHAKRALEISSAGSHNLLMSGPPGSGKTLLARALPSILPPMTIDEALDVTKLYSISGLLESDRPLVRRRPFRSPHHTISYAGLVGGGRVPRPGEISLAHRGVLFLDELPEFPSNALESMRQPLEDKVVTISRVNGSITYPANVMLVGAMNPCPCGFHGDPVRDCSCSATAIARYRKRLSGPLLDRIDIHIDVPRIEYEKLASRRQSEGSSAIRERVCVARERQVARLQGTGMRSNAEMGPAEIRQWCTTDTAAATLLERAVKRLQLSGRGYHRILKLSRTIADLAGADTIGPAHVAEAIQYRQRTDA